MDAYDGGSEVAVRLLARSKSMNLPFDESMLIFMILILPTSCHVAFKSIGIAILFILPCPHPHPLPRRFRNPVIHRHPRR